MSLVKPLTPHLWFDTQAREAAEFYCSVFPESRIDYSVVLPDTPSGDCEVMAFTLWGQPFMAISAGPVFKPNPSVSFFVRFDPTRDAKAKEKLDMLWAALAQDGTVLMPLESYPWSERYGWIQDRFGISWQLTLTQPEDEPRPPIMPSLLFVGAACGKAEEAMRYYMSVFDDSAPGVLARYPAGMAPEREGTLMYADFALSGTWFAVMDSAQAHAFGFNEALSFIIRCRDQKEIDYYWERLSSVPQAEVCGWCKDRFGVSWQVEPVLMDEVMASGDKDAIARVTRAFLDMSKIDAATLQAAAAGSNA